MSTWAERIRELQASGMKLSEIGNAIGAATSTVSDIANGRTNAPRADAGMKLDALHRERCQSQQSA